MTGVKVGRFFNGATITGLLAQPGVLDALFEAFADSDRMELLAQGVAAKKVLEGDLDPDEKQLAQSRLDDANEGLERELAGRAVYVDADTARAVRNGLLGARLGEGRADAWQSRRRIA